MEARRLLADAWADAQDPRAELVRLQLEMRELRRHRTNIQRENKVWDRINALMRAHRQEWAGEIAGLVDDCEYHRGVVAEVTLSADRFVELHERLLGLGPIQHLNLRAPFTHWGALCALPTLRQIVSIAVTDKTSFGDEEVIALAQSPNATGLRWVVLDAPRITKRGVEALAASPYLERVIELNLMGTSYNPAPGIWDDSGVISVEPNGRGEELAKVYGRRPWLIGVPYEMYKTFNPLRDDLAADDYGTTLELSGADGDESRVLSHPEHQYAVAVPGRPRMALDPRGVPGYDGVAMLEDVPVEVGVQIKELPPAHFGWESLDSLVEKYVEYRTSGRYKLEPLEERLLAPGTTEARTALYVLREKPRRQMEFLVASWRPDDWWGARRERPWVSYLTVRFWSEDLNPACWANLRAALLAGQRWDGTMPEPVAWPESTFATSDAKLALLPAAWDEARAKGIALAWLADTQAQALTSWLMTIATSNDPPWHEATDAERGAARRMLAEAGPPEAVEVLARNLGEVRTTHDLRAWCWQGIWALLNRHRAHQVPVQTTVGATT